MDLDESREEKEGGRRFSSIFHICYCQPLPASRLSVARGLVCHSRLLDMAGTEAVKERGEAAVGIKRPELRKGDVINGAGFR